MTGALLRTGSLDVFHPLGAEGNPVHAAAAQVRAAIARRLGRETADTFAVPQRNEDGDTIDWYAPNPGPVVPWSSATEDERVMAKQRLEEVREQVETLGREMASDPDPQRQVFARLLDHVCTFPSEEHVYLVDDRPVISFWGFRHRNAPSYTGAMLNVDALRDDQPGPRRIPWWWWLVGLLVLAALLALLLRACSETPPAFEEQKRISTDAGTTEEEAPEPSAFEPLRDSVQPPPAAEPITESPPEEQQPLEMAPPAELPGPVVLDRDIERVAVGAGGVAVRDELHSADVEPILVEKDVTRAETQRRGEDEEVVADGVDVDDGGAVEVQEALLEDPGVPVAEEIAVEAGVERQETELSETGPSEVELGEAETSEIEQIEAVPETVPTDPVAAVEDVEAQLDELQQDRLATGEPMSPEAAAETLAPEIEQESSELSPTETKSPEVPEGQQSEVAKTATAVDPESAPAKATKPVPPEGDAAAASDGTPPEPPPASLPDPTRKSSIPGTGGTGRQRPRLPPMIIPADAARTGSVRFADGGWRSSTSLQDGRGLPVDMGYKLDDGAGRVELRRHDGAVCAADVKAAMRDGKLAIDSVSDILCPDGTNFGRPSMECTPGQDGRADCSGRYGTGERFSVDLGKLP